MHNSDLGPWTIIVKRCSYVSSFYIRYANSSSACAVRTRWSLDKSCGYMNGSGKDDKIATVRWHIELSL